jgi:hypothetical protein
MSTDTQKPLEKPSGFFLAIVARMKRKAFHPGFKTQRIHQRKI